MTPLPASLGGTGLVAWRLDQAKHATAWNTTAERGAAQYARAIAPYAFLTPHILLILSRTSTGSRAGRVPEPTAARGGGHAQLSKCPSIWFGMNRVRCA